MDRSLITPPDWSQLAVDVESTYDFKRIDHGRNCETWYETSEREKKETKPASMRECQEKLPSFLFTTNIIPPDRVQIFDTFLFSGGAFHSSAGCLHSKLFLLHFCLFPSFLLFQPLLLMTFRV